MGFVLNFDKYPEDIKIAMDRVQSILIKEGRFFFNGISPHNFIP
jgi:hypothetical protein